MDKEVLLALVKLTTAQTEFINTVVKLLGEPKKEIPKPIKVEQVTAKEEIPLTPTVEESPTLSGETDDEFKPYLPGDTYKLGHKLHTMLKQAKDILIMLEDLTGIPAELPKKASDEDRVWRKVTKIVDGERGE